MRLFRKNIMIVTATSLSLFFVSCDKTCEVCDCWKNGQIVDNYKHCSGNLLSPNNDHKQYRSIMIETNGLDSVSCKYE
jgi:hypothetical protein